jgi:type II secretory pathway component PulF
VSLHCGPGPSSTVKLDEFAFLNQQLAGMLKSGIPLEGSLRELSSSMRRGKLRAQLEALQTDLAAGVPLQEAIGRRQLPELYVRLTQAGVAGGDLPGVLILLADYYNRLAGVMSRLKGLMVYPLIVLLASLGVSFLITMLYRQLLASLLNDPSIFFGTTRSIGFAPGMWLPTAVLAGLTVLWFLVVLTPRLRQWARWKLPGFREASIAQFSAAAAMLLKSGATLQGTLGLLQKAEGRTPAGREVARWMDLHQQGESKWTSFTVNSRVFPPLFVWVVAQGGENLAQGFQRASEIYQARSSNKIDLLLYASLPTAIMLLAGLIIGQVYPLVDALKNLISQFGI